MSIEAPLAAQEASLSSALSEGLVRLISSWGAGSPERIRAIVAPPIEALASERVAELARRLRDTGAEWGHYPGDPFVRDLSRVVMGEVLLEGSRVEGEAALEVARRRPTVLVGNHLSYVDVNVLDHLCQRAGFQDVVDRLVAVVGPKVYTEPIRLLASLCFGTIKTPQSSSIASGEAVMSPREVARLARHTLDVARERVLAGDVLLLFPEGSRTRSGGMQRLLPAVARYLEIPGLIVVPFGHTGCERLVPLQEDHVYPAEIRLRFGTPVPAERLLERARRNRGCVIDVVACWIAGLLPEAYRGVYARERADDELAEAHAIADGLLKDTEGALE